MKDATKNKMYLGIAILLVIAEILLIASGNGRLPISGLVMFTLFYAFAFSVRYTERFKGLSFTFQIFAFVAFTLFFPEMFTNWGFNTQILIVPSVQVIMFGMGTKLNLGDFIREFSKPVKIVIGTALIYIMMPLAALFIIKVYQFPAEVAAGIILIGACPAGAASNVMTYLAKGNLALALSITTLATLVAPVVTPFIMQVFAGQLIAVNTLGMMIGILNMIFVPVGAGLICNKILYGNMDWLKKAGNLIVLSVVCFIIGLGLIFVPFATVVLSLKSGLVLVFWMVAVVSFTKMMVDRAQGPANWMEMVLPKLSLSSIMLYIIIVAAHNKAMLLSIGPALFIATIAHNFLGFILGYGSAKVLRLKDADVRTFTIEVGLKNAGVGVGLAYDVLHSAAAALASLIFGTWMNVSGSTLANFWSQRQPREE
jgi:BASS family bile acid:Na+ symporter